MTISVKCVLCGQIIECEPNDTKILLEHLKNDHPELNLTALHPSAAPPPPEPPPEPVPPPAPPPEPPQAPEPPPPPPPPPTPPVSPPKTPSESSSEELVKETKTKAECRRKKLESINEEVKYEKLIKDHENDDGTNCYGEECDEPEIKTWGFSKKEDGRAPGMYVQLKQCNPKKEWIPPPPPEIKEPGAECPSDKQTQLRYHPSLLTNSFLVDKSTFDPDNDESCLYQAQTDKKEANKKTKPAKYDSNTDKFINEAYETTKSTSAPKSLKLREIKESIEKKSHSTEKNISYENDPHKSPVQNESLTQLQKSLQQAINTELESISKEKDILTALKAIRKRLKNKLESSKSAQPESEVSASNQTDLKQNENNEEEIGFVDDTRIFKLHKESVGRLEKSEKRIAEISNDVQKISKKPTASPENDLRNRNKSKKNTERSRSAIEKSSAAGESVEDLENESTKSHGEVKSKIRRSLVRKPVLDTKQDILEGEIDEEKYNRKNKHHNLSSETEPADELDQLKDETITDELEARRKCKSKSENKVAKTKPNTMAEQNDEERYIRKTKQHHFSNETAPKTNPKPVIEETVKDKLETQERYKSKSQNKLENKKQDAVEEEKLKSDNKVEKMKHDTVKEQNYAEKNRKESGHHSLRSETDSSCEEEQLNHETVKDQDSCEEEETENEENDKNVSIQTVTAVENRNKVSHIPSRSQNSSRKNQSQREKSTLKNNIDECESESEQNLGKNQMLKEKSRENKNLRNEQVSSTQKGPHRKSALTNESIVDSEIIEECESSDKMEHNPNKSKETRNGKSNESEQRETDKSGNPSLSKKSKLENASGTINSQQNHGSKKKTMVEDKLNHPDQKGGDCEEEIVYELDKLKAMDSATNRFKMRSPSGYDAGNIETSKNNSTTIDSKIKSIEDQLGKLKTISKEIHAMEKPIELEKLSDKSNTAILKNKLEQVEKLLAEGQRIVAEEKLLFEDLCGLENDPIIGDHDTCAKMKEELENLEQEFSRAKSKLESNTRLLEDHKKEHKYGVWKNKINRVEGHLMDLKSIATIERNLLDETLDKKQQPEKERHESKTKSSSTNIPRSDSILKEIKELDEELHNALQYFSKELKESKPQSFSDCKNLDIMDTCLSKQGIISNLPQLKESTNLYDAFSCNICANNIIAEQDRKERHSRKSKQKEQEAVTEEGSRLESGGDHLNEFERKTRYCPDQKISTRFENGDKSICKMNKDDSFYDPSYHNFYKINLNYAKPQIDKEIYSKNETGNKKSDETTDGTSFSNIASSQLEGSLTNEERRIGIFRNNKHISNVGSKNNSFQQSHSLIIRNRNKKHAENDVENQKLNLISNESTGKSVASRGLEFDNVNRKHGNQNKRKIQKQSSYLREKQDKNQTDKRHKSSIVKETRSVTEINHERSLSTMKRNFKRSSEPDIKKLIDKVNNNSSHLDKQKQIKKSLQMASNKHVRKPLGKIDQQKTEIKRLEGGLQSRNKHERCTRREHKIDTSFETNDYVQSKTQDSISDTSVSPEPNHQDAELVSDEKSSSDENSVIDQLIAAIEKDLKRIEELEKQGDALLSQITTTTKPEIKDGKSKASISDSNIQMRDKDTDSQKQHSGELVPAQRYVVKSSEPLIKTKYYRTTIQKSEKGKKCICCPNCKAKVLPMIKSTCERVSSNGLGAACILTFWPCAYMSCSATHQTKSYLYCSKCNYFLGTSDPPKKQKPIENESN